ncbi:hypothetical protein PENTCL1PPCAC_18091, partial [Pristionchus entomophagus]
VAFQIPEISESYGILTCHQMKTVALVDHAISYQTLWRIGSIRIKEEGQRSTEPHVAFANSYESKQFATYGTATLVVLFQSQLLGHQNELLRSLERAIESGR